VGSSLGVSLGGGAPPSPTSAPRSFSFARSFGPSLSPSGSPLQHTSALPGSPLPAPTRSRSITGAPGSPRHLPHILSPDDVVRSLEEHSLSPGSQGSRRLSEQPLECRELPDDIVLPFSDRPVEIKDLCGLVQNRPLYNLVRVALAHSSLDIDKHLALTREEMDDRRWVERLRKSLQPRSEFLWGRLELIFGLSGTHSPAEVAEWTKTDEDDQYAMVEPIYSDEPLLEKPINLGRLSPSPAIEATLPDAEVPPSSPLPFGPLSPGPLSPDPFSLRTGRRHDRHRSGSSTGSLRGKGFMECIDEVSTPVAPEEPTRHMDIAGSPLPREDVVSPREREAVGVRLTAGMSASWETAVESESEGTPSKERPRVLGPGLKFTFGPAPHAWSTLKV
jgi:hypothetical protein